MRLQDEFEEAVHWAMDHLVNLFLLCALGFLGVVIVVVLLPVWLPRLLWRTLARMRKGGS